jgi:hypothetical protein
MLSAQPQAEPLAATWFEQQYPQVRWTIDPSLEARVDGFTIAVTRSDNPLGTQTSNADKGARSVDFGPNEPGDFIVTVSANSAGAGAAPPVAEATARITVKPLPRTQISINDFQPDGTERFTMVLQGLNPSNQVIRGGGFINSDFVQLEQMTDENGKPMKFTTTRKPDLFEYSYVLNTPVEPGQPLMISNSGTRNGLIKPASGGTRMYSMNHHPGGDADVRRIELYRLPPGATLVSTSPQNLPQRVVDGRVQLYVEVMIPQGGSNPVSIRYRLPDQN